MVMRKKKGRLNDREKDNLLMYCHFLANVKGPNVVHLNKLKDIGETIVMIDVREANELVVKKYLWRTEEPFLVELSARGRRKLQRQVS